MRLAWDPACRADHLALLGEPASEVEDMTLQALRQVALGSLAAAGLLSVVGWTMETASAQDYPRYRRNSDEYAYLPPRKPMRLTSRR